MTPASLNIFASRLNAVCDEMGLVLRNAAFSPNIRDRLDFSCAVFDAAGELCAQAAHIPVHLGSMAFATRDIVERFDWHDGDQVIFNDPFLGGTHLPDVTVISPVFVDRELRGFVANRAHHADIGAGSPGSMPISACLDEEGVVISPTRLVQRGQRVEAVYRQLVDATRNPQESAGDFAAQLGANRAGVARLVALIEATGLEPFGQGLQALNDYGERLAREMVRSIPDGSYRYVDVLDDDGQGSRDIAIAVTLRIAGSTVEVDFGGTADQMPGNVNCPLAVAAAAVFYVFRCLMLPQTPACAGTFRPIRLTAVLGSLVNATKPAAVAAGNVETSTRIVDAVLGALAEALPEQIPAASHGSMNNVALGSAAPGASWDYYETVGGGMGAGAHGGGVHGVQTHMTNTLNTPVEVLESSYPIRVRRYALRRGSGGLGARAGGDGIVREFEFTAPAHYTLLTERREHAPWGLAGGEEGAPGRNLLNGKALPAKCEGDAKPGDRLTIETPGGGGYGSRAHPGSEEPARRSDALFGGGQ